MFILYTLHQEYHIVHTAAVLLLVVVLVYSCDIPGTWYDTHGTYYYIIIASCIMSRTNQDRIIRIYHAISDEFPNGNKYLTNSGATSGSTRWRLIW